MSPSTASRSLRLRGATLVVSVALLTMAASCSSDDAPVSAEGPSTTSAPDTTSAGSTPGTVTLPAGTVPATEVPTTEAPPTTIATTLPPPPPPTAPRPAPGSGPIIYPEAPSPRFDINVYDHIGPANVNPNTAGARSLVYVPHEVSGRVDVIDPATFQIVDSFDTGAESQHVIPSWDMSMLYVAASRGDRLTPIDPKTGKPGAPFSVDDPYNLYFTPDGGAAIVVAEGAQRLDFRDPKTFALRDSVQTNCAGINHLDFNYEQTFFIATCEFDGGIIKFDLAQHRVVDRITVDMRPSGRTSRNGHAQPQDVRLSSDGTVFYVADLQSNGLYLIDSVTFRQVGFIPTGVGTHSVYPSRDGRQMYVINRGTTAVGGPPHGQGSVAVLNPYTRSIEAVWPIPGGGSPDMGNITADGTQLWLGGRYDSEVYVFDLVRGGFQTRIRVGTNPHGLTVWPQPGRYSLGHTGNTR